MQMTFGRMSEPLTKVQKVDSTKTAQSYDFMYKYEDSNHPTAPTQIGHDHYTYDANGNPTLVTNDSTNTTREMYWDEDNRLMVLSDNGKTSRYTYNAAEKIWKNLSGNDEHHDLIRRSPKLPGSKLYYKTVSELIGHCPGVDCHAHRDLSQFLAFLHAIQDLTKQPVHIPQKLSVLMIHTVLETVDLF